MDGKSTSRPKQVKESRKMRAERLGACLPAKSVKAILRQDRAIGKVSEEATSLIAVDINFAPSESFGDVNSATRSVDAFLADLASSSLARSGAARAENGVVKRRKQSSPEVRQIIPEDLRRAADGEERFDFLRPVLATLDERKRASGQNKRSPTTNTHQKPGSAQVHKKNPAQNPNCGGGSTNFEGASCNGLIASAGARTMVGGGSGAGVSMLEQAGFNTEESLRGFMEEPRSAQARIGDQDDDEVDDDYDDC